MALVALLTWIVASLWMIIRGFKVNILWGIALIFLPMVAHIAFALLNFRLSTLGILVVQIISLLVLGASTGTVVSFF